MKSRFLARLGMTALSAALSALPALATTVAGTVMDSQGNPIAGAIVRLQLENCGAGGVCTLSGGGGIVSTLPVSTTTASDGTFSIVVNGNDALTPAGTFYEVRYIAQSGTIYSANYSITGTSFNLNIATPLGAMPPAPTPAAYTTVEQSGTTLQQRQLLNFTGPGISCADNTGLSRTDCTITAGSSSGITSLNGLSASSQTLSTGTSGTDFNIASAGSTHAFNFPNASASARGLVTSADWSTFNGKQNALSFPLAVSLGGTGGATAGTNGQVLISNGSAFAPGDPIVSGPDAAGVAPTKNPVQGGAIDNSTGCSAGPCVRSLVLANGAPAGSEYGLITRNIPSGTQAVSGTFWQATQPVSGTVTANQGGTWTVQPGNTANTTAWKVDGSAVTQPVSGTVTANAGTGTFNIQANASVNVAQIAAATAATGNGTSGAGNLRVNIASDNTAIANWGLGATGSAVPTGAHYIAGKIRLHQSHHRDDHADCGFGGWTDHSSLFVLHQFCGLGNGQHADFQVRHGHRVRDQHGFAFADVSGAHHDGRGLIHQPGQRLGRALQRRQRERALCDHLRGDQRGSFRDVYAVLKCGGNW